MAERVTITTLSDLSGSDQDVETVEFSLDGSDFEIDLDPNEREELRKGLADFIEHARVTGRKGKSKQRVSPGHRTGAAMTRHNQGGRPEQRGHSAAIREWATAQGYTVSSRGRIPTEVAEAYHARNK